MRFTAGSLIGLLCVGVATAQPPGGGGSRPEGGNRFSFFDPGAFFDRMAKGKDHITRADLDGLPEQFRTRAQEMFDRTLSELNITDGKLSREQYKSAVEQGMNRRGGGGANPDAVNRFIEERFKSLDKNGDGLLQGDELPEALKAEREKWDTNQDGFIDLNEYKAYSQARFGDRTSNSRGNVGTPATSASESPTVYFAPSTPDAEPRPVVFRAGKLPKELPPWFTQLDTDQDGQVGLYEWVKAGKSIEEFREMDSNDDGFLTAEEVLRFLKASKSPQSGSVKSTDDSTRSAGQPSTITPNANRTPPQNNDGRRGGPGGGGWGGGWGGGRGRPGGDRPPSGREN